MRFRLSSLTAALIFSLSGSAYAQDFEVPRTSWGVPDFQGMWKNNTVMPFQRPRELGTKQAYSEEEALQLERAAQQRVEDDNVPLDPDRPAPKLQALPPVGNYDLFWTDRGMFLPTINGEFRTSAIIDPPNGRIPERVVGFRERMQELRANVPSRNDGPEGRGLGERCLVAFGNNSGPVMSPVMYNSHLQIVQSPGYVTIVVEMVHDARIIKISDERSLASDAHQKWMGRLYRALGRRHAHRRDQELQFVAHVPGRTHGEPDRDRNVSPRRAEQNRIWIHRRRSMCLHRTVVRRIPSLTHG